MNTDGPFNMGSGQAPSTGLRPEPFGPEHFGRLSAPSNAEGLTAEGLRADTDQDGGFEM
jgi:hypothetical protein